MGIKLKEKFYGRLKTKNDKIPKFTKFSEHKPALLKGNKIINIKFDLEKDCFIEIKNNYNGL